MIGCPRICSGAGVLRSQDPEERAGGGVAAERSRTEELGDAEVEQLHLAVFRDHDVSRLEVAVHHERAVRVLDGAGHLEEELQPLPNREAAVVRVPPDLVPAHELHGEVGLTVGGPAAIEQAGDVRVRQAGENLPFELEAAKGVGILIADVDQLDRRFLLELPVGALAEVDRPHAAPAQLANQLPRPHRRRGFRRLGFALPSQKEAVDQAFDASLDRLGLWLVRQGDQLAELLRHDGVLRADLGKPSRPFGRSEVQELLEESVHLGQVHLPGIALLARFVHGRESLAEGEESYAAISRCLD